MYRKKIILGFLLAVVGLNTKAQELKARVTVNAAQVSSNVNPNTFKTLESALTTFLNTNKWTKNEYKAVEKIECNIFVNLQSTEVPNVYTGTITIQSTRPAYNSTYGAPIMNFKDEDVAFKYVEFQQLQFNDNRVAGNDPLASNLTALLAYYAYIIIGFDNHSYSLRGGNEQFLRAQNIINNAPDDGRYIKGWKAFEGLRNRYWLIENLLNSQYAAYGEVYYNYYRKGIDNFYDKPTDAQSQIVDVLNSITQFNADNPNTMINQFFFQGKSNELVKMFATAAPNVKADVYNKLSKADVSNIPTYQQLLK